MFEFLQHLHFFVFFSLVFLFQKLVYITYLFVQVQVELVTIFLTDFGTMYVKLQCSPLQTKNISSLVYRKFIIILYIEFSPLFHNLQHLFYCFSPFWLLLRACCLSLLLLQIIVIYRHFLF